MQRYFVNPEQMDNNTVTISGSDVHHIIRVMRFREGQSIVVSNGQGRDVIARIDQLSEADDVITATIERDVEPFEQRELPVRVSIAQSLPKSDKMDWIIQKGTELGAFQFVPFVSGRTIVRLNDKKEKQRIERWHKIAKEAAEQSHRSILPRIGSVLNWDQLLKIRSRFDLAVIAYENEQAVTLYEAISDFTAGSSIIMVIGPEGGFSREEVEQAVAAGFQPVSLGKRILRTETAALYGLSCLSYHYEQINRTDE